MKTTEVKIYTNDFKSPELDIYRRLRKRIDPIIKQALQNNKPFNGLYSSGGNWMRLKGKNKSLYISDVVRFVNCGKDDEDIFYSISIQFERI